MGNRVPSSAPSESRAQVVCRLNEAIRLEKKLLQECKEAPVEPPPRVPKVKFSESHEVIWWFDRRDCGVGIDEDDAVSHILDRLSVRPIPCDSSVEGAVFAPTWVEQKDHVSFMWKAPCTDKKIRPMPYDERLFAACVIYVIVNDIYE